MCAVFECLEVGAAGKVEAPGARGSSNKGARGEQCDKQEPISLWIAGEGAGRVWAFHMP